MEYITWTDLFQFIIMLCSVLTLVLSILNFNHKD